MGKNVIRVGKYEMGLGWMVFSGGERSEQEDAGGASALPTHPSLSRPYIMI